MSTCTSPPPGLIERVPRRSLQSESVQEAEKHKWYLSEQAGRDRGKEALLDWVKKHWSGYLRSRWLEHLQGVNFWFELKAEAFGLLGDRFQGSPYFNEIIRQFLAGGENLTILNWALDNDHPIPQIEEILLAIDINSCRLKCELEMNLRPENG